MPGFFDALEATYNAQQAGLEAGLRGENGPAPAGPPACMAAWSRARVRGLCRRKPD